MVSAVGLPGLPPRHNINNQTLRTATGPQPAFAQGVKQASRPNPVHFGKLPDTTFVIPPKSLVVTVPGLCGPKRSIEGLSEYLRSKGHQVHALRIPGVTTAEDTWESRDWLMQQVDQIRIEEASNRFIRMVNRVNRVETVIQKRVAIQDLLQLNDDPVGIAAARSLLKLLMDQDGGYRRKSNLTREILALRQQRMEKHNGTLTDRNRLPRLTNLAREQLTHDLRPYFYKQAFSGQSETELWSAQSAAQAAVIHQAEQALNKTVNHILDQLAPRVVVVGHSLGGFVGTQAAFEKGDDIGMVVSLGSPVNGTDDVPPGFGALDRSLGSFLPSQQEHLRGKIRDLFESFGDAISQINHDSPQVLHLQGEFQPDDTSVVSVANPNDGLVRPENAAHNENYPGRLNITVTPLPAKMDGLLPMLMRIPFSLSRIPRELLVEQTGFWKGLLQHCGLVDNHEHYWPQEGNMLQQVFEGPDAIRRIRRLLAPKNYEPMRAQVLDLLIDKLHDAQRDDAKKPGQLSTLAVLQDHYAPLTQDLRHMSQEYFPFQDGTPEKAATLLHLLTAPQSALPAGSQ